MTWAAITRTPASWATDTGITGQQQTALAGLALPADLATAGSLAATAATSHRANITAARQSLAAAMVTPWAHGTPARGRSVSHTLTPSAAQDILATESAGFAAMLAFMIPADTAAQLAQKLAVLNTVLPAPALAAALRTASQYASHESAKFFLANAPEAVAQPFTGGQREHDAADHVAALAEAIASDTTPADLLAQFASARANRHAEQAAALASYGGAIEWAMYLAGDLETQLAGITAPNSSAPYSAAFALFGSVDALATLKGELAL
ncbi:hypothetical protein [Oceanobacter mangrovi]|uniref:hypothetical protein n=1 Tax=Oceanobacter mangrovi TaxID=2862510 RepID=UPI001C8ECEEC|nr:hypothetical protein [Oceanobacter mangrovi]